MKRLIAGEHPDPHQVLGPHRTDKGSVVRAIAPGQTELWLISGGSRTPMRLIHPSGLFEAEVDPSVASSYRLATADSDFDDPYRFMPTLGELDLHLIGEGRHHDLWRFLGSRRRVMEGVSGTSFAVWAPNARSVRVVGDFNSWDGRAHPMRSLSSSGIWELFIPGVEEGACYKFEISTSDSRIVLKGDPYARSAEVPPGTASIVTSSDHVWSDSAWMGKRAGADPLKSRMSVYECHLGSWRRVPRDGNRPFTYREVADVLPDYLCQLGFTHVEFMPVSEHPFGGSWGYQVSYYFAPTSRYGTPDDFKHLVDRLHQAGIGVILDWVPAHFPKDDFALAEFDGSDLYEHSDPRQGEQPDWGTLVFNLGRNEVRNFLISNAIYWCEEFHVDGLRVDAVASMLYLDYSRKPGEWIPNKFGGRENLEAVEFFKELNTRLYARFPGIVTIAEESTSWPGVSRPAHLGGLGFGMKWSLGWMNDTLRFFSKDPIHRRFHHNDLTFGLLYAWHENFVLPLSHDEVVHGKGSLIGKMPGDRWQRFANLRALYAWMWAHPGKQLLFMGGELAQVAEWSHDASIDWHLVDDDMHAGVSRLISDLNRCQADHLALWEQDFSQAGFEWIDANDTDSNVLSFIRRGTKGDLVVCVANLAPIPRYAYRVGLPVGGVWRFIINTDEQRYGGSGVTSDVVTAMDSPWHGQNFSAAFTLPPLGVVWLVPG